jgi:hypothetical protein
MENAFFRIDKFARGALFASMGKAISPRGDMPKNRVRSNKDAPCLPLC